MFWLRVGLLYVILYSRLAAEGRVSAMNERNFYYIGIAFFGMINGIFNQLALLFALIHVQVLAPALLFGNAPADRDVFLADGVDRHHHPCRHPGRDL